MTRANPERIVQRLFSATYSDSYTRVFTVLDAARDPRIRPAVIDSDCRHRSLFPHDVPEALAEVAPYVVELKPKSTLLPLLVNEGWGNSWGIYLASNATLAQMRAHLTGLMKVENEEGDVVNFRFYDPRVLRTYLPTCIEPELDVVFGDVLSFFIEMEQGQGLLELFRRDRTSGPLELVEHVELHE